MSQLKQRERSGFQIAVRGSLWNHANRRDKPNWNRIVLQFTSSTQAHVDDVKRFASNATTAQPERHDSDRVIDLRLGKYRHLIRK